MLYSAHANVAFQKPVRSAAPLEPVPEKERREEWCPMELAIEIVKLLSALVGLTATIAAALQARSARKRQQDEGRSGNSGLRK